MGIMLAYLFGTFLNWRMLAVLGIFPSFVLFPGLFFVPESPWSLAAMGKDFEISLLYLQGFASQISSEKEEIIRSQASSRETITICSEELKEKKYRYPLMLGVVLFMLQQLSGINGLLCYSSYVLESAGISNGIVATFGLGVVLVLATGVATWFSEKAGRRVLLLVSASGMSGMTVSLFLFAAAFYLKSAISSDSNLYDVTWFLSISGVVGMMVFFPWELDQCLEL